MKDYAARKWVTVDELLTTQPCELIYAHAYSSGNAIENTAIYDGENTNGELLINFNTGTKSDIPFNPPEPVKCQRGLYVDIGENTEGVFVMWRNLPRKPVEF